jgi:hypothetical protein
VVRVIEADADDFIRPIDWRKEADFGRVEGRGVREDPRCRGERVLTRAKEAKEIAGVTVLARDETTHFAFVLDSDAALRVLLKGDELHSDPPNALLSV